MDPAHFIPDLDDIRAAAARIAPYAHVTPVLRSRSLDALTGAELHFKCENLQRVGAFKFRGACNAVFALDDATARQGIVTQSSGNHGAAIALAGRLRGVPTRVVVPSNAPKAKLAAIRDFGAEVILCESTLAAREAACARILAEHGGTLIPPYDDARVIAGQATAALELLHQVDALAVVMAPVSGGGLLSGTALAAKTLRPEIEVLGAEPEGAADACQSLREGRRIADRKPNTICDGLRASLSARTFEIVRSHVNDILLASDEETLAAMRLLWERLKVIVEPSGAVPLAALLKQRERFAGRRIGIILSGGNLDLDALPWNSAN